jgi:uncharacterized membrane protein YccC
MIGALFADLSAELGDLRLKGAAAQFGYRVSFAVALSVVLAMAIPLQEIWWAAVSAFMVSQATRPASLRRGVLRIIGTICGAAIGLGCASTVAYDHVLCALFLLIAGFLGTLGFLLSAVGYAWLLGAITAMMVVLMSLPDPTVTLSGALNRVAEVVTGTAAAMLGAWLFAPNTPAPIVASPGFTDLLGVNRPALLHAWRSGITVMLIPSVWVGFDLPGLPQMAITAAAVMAVQPPGGFEDHTPFVARAVQRLMGCLLGGAVGLLILALSLTNLLGWLFVLAGGVFVCTQIQASARGVGYVGTQAGMVYIMTLVQGRGPPTSIYPGIDRLVGISGGLLILLLVSLVLWPMRRQQPA